MTSVGCYLIFKKKLWSWFFEKLKTSNFNFFEFFFWNNQTSGFNFLQILRTIKPLVLAFFFLFFSKPSKNQQFSGKELAIYRRIFA